MSWREDPNWVQLEASLPPMMTTQQVADIVGVSAGTLQNWRSSRRKRVPVAIHLGRRVRYARPDVIDWLWTEREKNES